MRLAISNVCGKRERKLQLLSECLPYASVIGDLLLWSRHQPEKVGLIEYVGRETNWKAPIPAAVPSTRGFDFFASCLSSPNPKLNSTTIGNAAAIVKTTR